MTEKISFTSDKITVDVEVDGVSYTLTEASGKQAAEYRNACLACAVMSPTGKPQGVRNLVNTEALLVSLCLTNNEDNKNVPVSVIRDWPGRVVNALFEKAQEISGLGKFEDEDEAKNEQDGTTDGSD